jgi:hypothetical protein
MVAQRDYFKPQKLNCICAQDMSLMRRPEVRWVTKGRHPLPVVSPAPAGLGAALDTPQFVTYLFLWLVARRRLPRTSGAFRGSDF